MVSDITISKATQLIADKFKPKYIILFGSQARGDANKYSDVDLLIVCPFTGERIDFIDEIDELLEDLVLPIDLLVMTPEEYEKGRNYFGTFAYPASHEGKVLYERD